MARNKNLRNSIINQILDAINNKNLKSPIPSISNLSELLNTSRTTIRYSIKYLIDINILEKKIDGYHIIRKPESKDIINIEHQENEDQLNIFSIFFINNIIEEKPSPGTILSELALSKEARVNTKTVNSFLIQFSKYGLIDYLNRGQWVIKPYSKKYAEKLFETRKLFEVYGLKKFMSLPRNDPKWNEMKLIHQEHLDFKRNISTNHKDFSKLDKKFHRLIISSTDNPFIDDFFEIASLIYHNHYQWDHKNPLKMSINAIADHLPLINDIINENKDEAILKLKCHLENSKKAMEMYIKE